jgi:glycosyltransferase involved in cell wall biosynthesis
MPRSTGSNHRFGDEVWRAERIELEKKAFAAIEIDETSRVLAIGPNFGKHLADEYGLSIGEKDYLVNGLYFDRYKEYSSREFQISDLQKFDISIPPNAKIVFSWARASIAKGLKEMIEAWEHLEHLFPDHYMIIQAPNNSGENDYFSELRKLESRVARTIVIDDFNPAVWQTILRIRNTEVVCVPSVMDPIPHTAIEAKLFADGMRYAIVGSNVDGVIDVFSDKECVWVNPYDPDDFQHGLMNALKLSEEERTAMIGANSQSIEKFNYLNTIRKFLKSVDFI